MHSLLDAASFLLMTALCAPVSAGQIVSLSPATVQPGGVMVATVTTPVEVTEIRVGFFHREGQPRPQFQKTGGVHTALVPVPASAPAGRATFHVKVFSASGLFYSDQLQVNVLPRQFPTQRISMSKSTASGMSSNEWAKERGILYPLFDRPPTERKWDGLFVNPLAGAMTSTSGWGRVRYVNGRRHGGHHQGIDLRAATGTPVRSDAAGVVVLAQVLTMRGGTIVVDHGMSLFSAYNHLSQIDVTVGQQVAAKQVIGRAGATGFVNGPHLHWEARVGRVPVDPMLLTKQPLALP